MGNDQRDAQLTPRQRIFWGLYDFSTGVGLEIGPLHQAAVPREHGDVKYLDVFDREQLLINYGDDEGVPGELIPEIDFSLSDGTRVRSIPEAVGEREPFDWVMASHVVEHVPDVIGWLDQIAQVTADGGDLILAVPDRRYCFDLHRPGTTVGQLIQAHELGDVVPSVRAVYDYKRGHAAVRAPMIWDGKPVGYENRVFDLTTVLAAVEKARAGEYIDGHVWLFTPGSFLEQIVELRALGLSAWKVKRLIPTQHNQLEFYAVLERLPRDTEWTPELLADEPPLPRMPDWLAEWVDLRAEVDSAHATIASLKVELANKRFLSPSRRRVLRRWIKNLPGGRRALAAARRPRRAR